MAFQSIIETVERQSGFWAARLVDENGAGVGTTILTSLTGTLYDKSTSQRTIINSRTTQNILNANQCLMDIDGNFRFNWLPADQAFVNPNREKEEHVFLITAKWTSTDGNPREANHELHFLCDRVVYNA